MHVQTYIHVHVHGYLRHITSRHTTPIAPFDDNLTNDATICRRHKFGGSLIFYSGLLLGRELKGNGAKKTLKVAQVNHTISHYITLIFIYDPIIFTITFTRHQQKNNPRHQDNKWLDRSKMGRRTTALSS